METCRENGGCKCRFRVSWKLDAVRRHEGCEAILCGSPKLRRDFICEFRRCSQSGDAGTFLKCSVVDEVGSL